VLKISAALFLWAKNEKNYEVKELAKITKTIMKSGAMWRLAEITNILIILTLDNQNVNFGDGAGFNPPFPFPPLVKGETGSFRKNE
jgi:hypothetical protein